jgi:CheY-like chemotaxis protein
MQRRLLIVEDEIMVAWALVETVHELGWKVCATVSTEEAAVEAASHLKPDAILMDYRLAGGGDGLLAARRIREATDIPIIFCTAYVAGLRSQILSVPRVQLVGKPVRPLCLQKALEAAVKADGADATEDAAPQPTPL